MIPIPSLGGTSLGAMVFAILVALAPAVVTWWTDRRLLARRDDPALPELIANRRRANVVAIAVAIALLLVFAGRSIAWGIPLLLAALAAAGYPFRTRILGETWSFGRYLLHSGLSFLGGFGFWIAVIYAPIAVQEALDRLGPARLAWGAAVAAVLAAILFAWEEWYPRIWLRTHAAQPLDDATLTPRFEEIVRRAGTIPPAVYRVGPKGSRFVNAVALPSVKRPAVAMGNALLELLDADETTAIFAHEVAHFDHFTPRRIARIQLINRILIIVSVSFPLIAAMRAGEWAAWIGWVWPLVVIGALLQRAAKSQQHETESDLRAATLCGDPEALVRGLVKLHGDARIPRRYAVDVERAASHPSLVRRIQAIRASGGISPAVDALGTATVVQSTRLGSWVVIDDTRAYWLDGVPEGTSPELAALRDAASSYRALNYADMVELRVDATGDARTIRTRTRAGDVWSVPIARDDVARVQRALDVVDLRLGKVGPGPATGTPKFIAIVTAAIAIVAGQAGIVLVPIALALWKAGPALMAALGAMCLMRAILGAFETSIWMDQTVVRIGLAGLAAAGIASLYVARRMLRANDAPAHFRLTMGALLGLAVLTAAALAWQAARLRGSIVGEPLVGTFATVLAGIVAALFTTETRRHRAAGFAGLAAVAALATVSVDRTAWTLRHALTETVGRAVPDVESDVGSVAHQLRVSPTGTHFMVTRFSQSRQNATVVLLGRVGGAVRDLPAVAGEFVDSSHVLLLDVLDGAIELRLEHVDSVGRPTWVDTIPQADLAEPRLIIDRDSNGWAIMGQDSDDLNVLFAGTIDRKGSTRRVVLPDSVAIVGEPIVFGQGSTVMIPVYGQGFGDAISLSPLAMLGANALRSELLRVADGRTTRVASLRGYPQCGEPLGGMVACASRHMRATSLYTIDAKGTAVEVVQLPVQDLGFVALGPGTRASSMKFDRSIVDIDLAARRMTRFVLPPNTEYATEVSTGPGFVVTLSHADNRKATVRRYRVE